MTNKKRLLTLSTAPLLLTACAFPGSSTSEANTSAEERPLTAGEFLDQMSRLSGVAFCVTLEEEIESRNDVPEMLDCKEDADSETNQRVVIVDLADQTEFLLDQDEAGEFDLSEQSAPDLVLAPLDALAKVYQEIGEEELAHIDFFLLWYRDLCQHIWEVAPTTLTDLANNEISLEEAGEEIEIVTMFPDCPPAGNTP